MTTVDSKRLLFIALTQIVLPSLLKFFESLGRRLVSLYTKLTTDLQSSVEVSASVTLRLSKLHRDQILVKFASVHQRDIYFSIFELLACALGNEICHAPFLGFNLLAFSIC